MSHVSYLAKNEKIFEDSIREDPLPSKKGQMVQASYK